MATTAAAQPTEQYEDKGLKSGALGLVSSIVMGVCLDRTRLQPGGDPVLRGGRRRAQGPAVAVLAFIPMLLCSIGYSEMNKADPDCGTTFTWGARAFGPKTGWAGGWAIVAADILVMASLAQVAGQYVFLLFGAKGIGQNPASSWVLLVGIIWIIAMSYICYRGIEVSAWFQRILLTVEVVMLLVLSVTALVKQVATGHHPEGQPEPQLRLAAADPPDLPAFISGLILMLFIYWGWDTAVSVNEETKDKAKTPGRAAIISTVMLLVTYAIVIFAVQAFAGIGTTGIGLANPEPRSSTRCPCSARAIFGGGGFGTFLSRLLILMVLSSAAASTQTTILPTARTTLSMAAYKAIPHVVRQDPPEVPDADRVHDRDGRHLDHPLHPVQLLRRRQQHRRCGHRDRPVHRLLLRADRLLAASGTTGRPCSAARATCGCGASCRLLGGLIM